MRASPELDTAELLDHDYIIENRQEVLSCVNVNQYGLLEPLTRAAERIRSHFGSVPLGLKMANGPEADFVFVVIKTSLSPDEVVQREERLTDEWYINLPINVQEHMNFTEEFVGFRLVDPGRFSRSID